MRSSLTNRQKEVLNFIETYFNEKGYPPTVRDICKGMGLSSTSTVHGHLKRLVKKGCLTKEDYKPRTISSSVADTSQNSNENYKNIPVIGNVAAGTPNLAVENTEEIYPVPDSFLDLDAQYFILKIKGNSMIEAGILDGDYILVKQQNTAINGDIVVALINDLATVKTFYKEDGYIRLQPENSSMEPIILNKVKILGLVKGVFRKLLNNPKRAS